MCEGMEKDEKGRSGRDMAMLVTSSLPQGQCDSESLCSLFCSSPLYSLTLPFPLRGVETLPPLLPTRSVSSGYGVQEAESQNGGGGTQRK